MKYVLIDARTYESVGTFDSFDEATDQTSGLNWVKTEPMYWNGKAQDGSVKYLIREHKERIRTVGQLIAELDKFPKDAIVGVYDSPSESGGMWVESVEMQYVDRPETRRYYKSDHPLDYRSSVTDKMVTIVGY